MENINMDMDIPILMDMVIVMDHLNNTEEISCNWCAMEWKIEQLSWEINKFWNLCKFAQVLYFVHFTWLYTCDQVRKTVIYCIFD